MDRLRFPTPVTVLSLLLLLSCVAAVDVDKCLMYALSSEIHAFLRIAYFGTLTHRCEIGAEEIFKYTLAQIDRWKLEANTQKKSMVDLGRELTEFTPDGAFNVSANSNWGLLYPAVSPHMPSALCSTFSPCKVREAFPRHYSLGRIVRGLQG